MIAATLAMKGSTVLSQYFAHFTLERGHQSKRGFGIRATFSAMKWIGISGKSE